MTDEDDHELGELLRTHATRYRAGPALESAIRSEIASQAALDERAPRARRWHWPAWGLAAAGFAVGVVVSTTVMLLAGGPRNPTEELAGELVSSHVRALMVDHLTDVASSDQHTVKPWFQGKLDYSPPVQDLAAQGFALVGGRLDYLAGRAVAALVYRRHGHLINVFIWPAADGSPAQLVAHQGYSALHWHSAGMQYWAVSDIHPAELERLSSLLRP